MGVPDLPMGVLMTNPVQQLRAARLYECEFDHDAALVAGIAEIERLRAALQEIADSGAEHPWGGPAAFARKALGSVHEPGTPHIHAFVPHVGTGDFYHDSNCCLAGMEECACGMTRPGGIAR